MDIWHILNGMYRISGPEKWFKTNLSTFFTQRLPNNKCYADNADSIFPIGDLQKQMAKGSIWLNMQKIKIPGSVIPFPAKGNKSGDTPTGGINFTTLAQNLILNFFLIFIWKQIIRTSSLLFIDVLHLICPVHILRYDHPGGFGLVLWVDCPSPSPTASQNFIQLVQVSYMHQSKKLLKMHKILRFNFATQKGSFCCSRLT